MTRERKSSFRGKIIRSAHNQKDKGKSGYLKIPNGVKLLKLPEDERTFELDFLPYIVTTDHHMELDVREGVAVKDSLWYRTPFKVHRNVGVNNNSVICPTTIGKKCPICEYRVKRIKEGADKEEFKLLYPQERSLYVVIPIGHKDYDEEPYVWDMADFLFQELLIDELEENDENEDFFTLDNGKTVQLKLKWKTIGTNPFPEVVSLHFSERDPYKESILEDLPKLDDMLQILSYEAISNLFLEIDEDNGGLKDVDDEEEQKKPDTSERKRKQFEEKRGIRGVRKNTQHIKEEEEEEEDEKVEKPSRGRSKREEDKKDEKEKCPHGHQFGVDTDKYKECDVCDLWDDCIEEKERE